MGLLAGMHHLPTGGGFLPGELFWWNVFFFLFSSKLQNVANTVEMAASSSNMLQIARKNGQNGKSKKESISGKIVIPKAILEPFFHPQYLMDLWIMAWVSLLTNRTAWAPSAAPWGLGPGMKWGYSSRVKGFSAQNKSVLLCLAASHLTPPFS